MITKKQLADSIALECDIISHLFSKLPKESYSFRPKPEMRSMEELLRYLTVCAHYAAHGMVTGDWEQAKEIASHSKTFSIEEFPEQMQKQKSAVTELLLSCSEDELLNKKVEFPWGAKDVLGMAFVSTCLRFLTAYRMQLFIYAKSFGLTGLVTSNCWRGVDQPS